jgi:predicted flap endonuclease-1-like 5' DNA nuclease
MGQMRENLATRDRRVHDLEQQLADSEARVANLTERLASWNDRVAPLTQKLRQQQALIRRYRERLAEPAGNEPLDLDSAAPNDSATDDLKQIRGIGPALERRLNRHGIRSFEQIANLSDEELEDMAEKLAIAPNLIHRDRWVEQARALAKPQAEPA